MTEIEQVGNMNKLDQDVGTGLVGAPACGEYVDCLIASVFKADDVSSVMKLQIRVDDNGCSSPYPHRPRADLREGVISDVKFKTFGCGSAIASSSYMTERVKGMSLAQAGAVKNTEIAKELCLPPVKRVLADVVH